MSRHHPRCGYIGMPDDPQPSCTCGGNYKDKNMASVSIKGLDKADVLCALVNAAKPLGMGFLQDNGKPMTKAEAQEWIDKGRRHDMGMVNRDEKIAFDYVKGRPIKADITGDEFDPWGYDRDQGEGAAEKAIASLRAGTKDT